MHSRTTDCILGGTLEKGRWDTELDPATAKAVIARCARIVPRLDEGPPVAGLSSATAAPASRRAGCAEHLPESIGHRQDMRALPPAR